MHFKQTITRHSGIFKKSLFITALLTCFCAFSHITTANAAEERQWQRIETQYTIIHYQMEKDLGKFCANVKNEPNDWGLKMLFADSHQAALKDMVSKKTDGLFDAVKNILGMKKEIDKIFIHLYSNEPALNRAYSEIYNKPCNVRAWYRETNSTVYINANDLDETILAHELAHAITDHYLLIRPPRRTAEIIARYVSMNLKRPLRDYDTSETSEAYSVMD